MCMAMFVFVFMVMMRVSMVMVVLVVMLILQMNIKFHAIDSRFFPARDVPQVVTIHAQFFQLVLELVRVHAQIQQRADEHVAADAAEDIEVESFHA